jgi:hypothetical protein
MTGDGTTEATADGMEDFSYAAEQPNLALAVLGGLAAALVGAILWAIFVYVTNMELGLVAIALGALVGITVRKFGRGVDPQFGVIGAICAAVGWGLGMLLCDIAFLAKEAGRPTLEVATALGLSQSITLVVSAADPMDLLFLAIAVWEGWKFSRHTR